MDGKAGTNWLSAGGLMDLFACFPTHMWLSVVLQWFFKTGSPDVWVGSQRALVDELQPQQFVRVGSRWWWWWWGALRSLSLHVGFPSQTSKFHWGFNSVAFYLYCAESQLSYYAASKQHCKAASGSALINRAHGYQHTLWHMLMLDAVSMETYFWHWNFKLFSHF